MSPHACRYHFTLRHAVEPLALGRILDVICRFGLIPHRLLSRKVKTRAGDRRFRLDFEVDGLDAMRAATLAAKLGNIPDVLDVDYAAGAGVPVVRRRSPAQAPVW
jgi:hypothetical protein